MFLRPVSGNCGIEPALDPGQAKPAQTSWAGNEVEICLPPSPPAPPPHFFPHISPTLLFTLFTSSSDAHLRDRSVYTYTHEEFSHLIFTVRFLSAWFNCAYLYLDVIAPQNYGFSVV